MPMANAAELRAGIKVCMFDQYGTVVDMQAGLTAVAAPYLRSKGWPGDPHSFVTWWRRTHFENSMIDALLQREHTPYREIGHRSVAWVLERAGIPYTMDEVRHLVAQIETLRPFPEVPEALARLKARFKIVVLSNGDPDMLEAAKRHHAIPFDAVISAAVANAFKPHAATYTRAAEIVGVSMRRGPLRRQPQLRLHRRQVGGHAHGLHRPPAAAVWRDPASARPHRRRHEGARGCPVLTEERRACTGP